MVVPHDLLARLIRVLEAIVDSDTDFAAAMLDDLVRECEVES
jgi:hypothetical protein